MLVHRNGWHAAFTFLQPFQARLKKFLLSLRLFTANEAARRNNAPCLPIPVRHP